MLTPKTVWILYVCVTGGKLHDERSACSQNIFKYNSQDNGQRPNINVSNDPPLSQNLNQL